MCMKDGTQALKKGFSYCLERRMCFMCTTDHIKVNDIYEKR